jgi:hypothetical protein
MMDEVPKKIVSVNISCAVLYFVYTRRFGDAWFGLALHGQVQSDPVWRGPVECFICEFKMTSHI